MYQSTFVHDYADKDIFLGQATKSEAYCWNGYVGDFWLTPNNLIVYRFGDGEHEYTCGELDSLRHLKTVDNGLHRLGK